MGCLTVILSRVGSVAAGMSRVLGGITACARRLGGVEASAERIGGVTACAERKGGVRVSMGLVCGPNLGDYDVLWVQDGPLLTIDEGYLITKK